MKSQKEQQAKARRANGAPYLKLKMVKVMPRQKNQTTLAQRHTAGRASGTGQIKKPLPVNRVNKS